MGVQKFKVKPVIIEALELRWDNWGEMCEFAGVGKLDENKPEGCYVDPDGRPTPGATDIIGLLIPGPAGIIFAKQDDWVIKDPDGQLYCCEPSEFESTFEPFTILV